MSGLICAVFSYSKYQKLGAVPQRERGNNGGME
jgi:hypothetical protein